MPRAITLIAAAFAALGLPIDDWARLAVLGLLIGLLLAGRVTRDRRRWLAIAALVVLAAGARALLPAPVIQEGIGVFVGKGDVSMYRAALPAPVFARLSTAWDATWKDVPHPVLQTPKAPFDRSSVYGVFGRPTLTRVVGAFDYADRRALRFDGFNDRALNVYGDHRPRRDDLPFYVRWDIPAQFAASGARLCWRGEIFAPAPTQDLVVHAAGEPSCRALSEWRPAGDTLTLWAVVAEPAVPFAARIDPGAGYAFADYAALALSILAGVAAALLGVVEVRWKIALAYGAALGLTVLSMVVHKPDTLGGFVLFEGGNDGLVHYSYGRDILAALAAGDWRSALIGGEAPFDFQPGYRYLHAATAPLFGATMFGPLLLTALVPFVLYALMKLVLGVRWAVVLTVMFFAVPVFESFGFWQHYFAYQMVRGFAEPIAYLLLFLGLVRVLALLGDGGEGRHSVGALLLTALAFAGAVILRNNLALGVVACLGFAVLASPAKNWSRLIPAFALGLAPVLLIPLHNYVFAPDNFVLLTVSATRPFNMGASPGDWMDAVAALARGDFSAASLRRVVDHLNGELKPTAPWRHFALAVTLYMLFRPAACRAVRALALTALALQIQLLFYRVGGRYGYAAWILTLIVTLAWVQTVALPAWRRRRANFGKTHG